MSSRTWLSLILAAVMLCLVAAIAVDAKLQALGPSPPIANEVAAGPGTRVRFALRPARGLELIRGRVPSLAARLAPAGLLRKALPYEIALLFEPDFTDGAIQTTLFVNDQRFAPLIIEGVREARLPEAAPYVDWVHDTLQSKGRGYLHMDGFIPMMPAARETVSARWGRPPIALPMLPMEGGHFIELVLDNRDGGAAAILLTLLADNGVDEKQLMQRDVVNALIPVSDAYLSADPLEDGAFDCYISFAFKEGVDKKVIAAVENSFELLIQHVEAVHGLDIEGDGAADDIMFEGAYTIRGLAAAFGLSGEAAPPDGALSKMPAPKDDAPKPNEEKPADEPAPEDGGKAEEPSKTN